MFSKSIFVFAFLAVAKLAVATPPACMLAAIMTQDDPSKVEDICKNGKMSGYISSACGDDTQVAMNAYADVCKQAGVKVAASSSSSPSSTASSDDKSSKTNSNSASATSVSSSDSASATATPTGKSASHSGKSAAITSIARTTSVVVYTSASFDSDCSCTKTAAITSTEVSGPTGLATQATGAATGTAAAPAGTGAAGRVEMGMGAFAAVAMGVFAVL